MSPSLPAAAAQSPLWMVTRAPRIVAFVASLQDSKREVCSGRATILRFSRSELDAVRSEFATTIRHGEEKLHRLCSLLGSVLFRGTYDLRSIVIAEMPSSRERFTLRQKIDRSTLLGATDLDLGNRMLGRVQMDEGDGWRHPRLVANFVEYQPLAMDAFQVHKMISRIKAEEEIWNKVVYEIFGLDEVVRQDKHLARYSQYVKDVFGVKIVVSTPGDVHPLHLSLQDLLWNASALEAHGVPHTAATERPHWLEDKDYLEGKRSGWRALKSVLSWWDHTFEVQIQPLANYFLEQEYLTRESHAAFKERRDLLYEEVGRADPVFTFFRQLLQWLFRERAVGPPPELAGVEIRVVD